MASAEYKHSILWRGEDPTQSRFKPAYDGTKKVARYRRGQVPEWAEEGKKTEKKKREEPEEDLKKASKRRRQAAAVILESKASDSASSRLARLQRSEAAPATETGTQRLLRHRRVEEAVILEKEDEDEEDEIEKKEVFKEELDMDLKPTALADASFDLGAEDGDLEIQQIRRERLRERALSKRKIEEDVLKAELEDEQEEVPDEESEYESESDEDDRRGPLMKPVFVSKANRETVREKEMIEKEEEDARRKKEVRALERKAESKVLVIDKIQEEAEAERLAGEEDDRSDIELMDDDDEKNEAEEYELWKIRELKRIKRDKEERLQRQKEIEFVLKRRQMTDEERAKDDARLDAANPKRAEVKQFNFLQKYYHRGGFFQDKAVSGEEVLYLRDYHEPLEEEKYDKQLLPKAMQLRRGEFGKKGQVKHSHLTDVDTTDMSAAWAQSSKVVQRYQEKMAAAKGVGNFERPSMKSRGEA